MARRSLLLAFALAFAGQAAGRQSVLEYVHEKLAGDPAIDGARRKSLEEAIGTAFAGYATNVVRPGQMEDVRTLMHVISEGILDELPSDRIAEVGFAAYQAIWRGAPGEAVDGIALYGFQKQLPADTIATWANGYRDGTRGGVPGEVMAGVIHAAMARSWSDATFNTTKWALVTAAKRNWDTRIFAAHLLDGLEKDPEHPGKVQAATQDKFARADRAKTAVAPPPGFDGSFPTAPPREERRIEKPAVAKEAPARTAKREPVTAQRPQRPIAAPEIERVEPLRRVALPEVWPSLDREARSYLGTPYVWGGLTHRGIDCSGFTMSSYRDGAQLQLPRASKEQWRSGTPVQKADLREGDLVFFDTMGNGVSHVAMVVDARRQKVIHASSSKGVTEADFGGKWFQSRYLGARRVTR